jgi:heavy metal translocating P-type ATPase
MGAGRAEPVLLAGTVGGLAAGLIAAAAGAGGAADLVWAVTTVVGLVPAVVWVAGSLRRREPGVDLVAVLALVGTLLVEEYLAGAVIAVMLASGRALESRARARASGELTALLSRAPHVVHRYEPGPRGPVLSSPALDAVRPGDLLLVKPGEIVPVDGRVEAGSAVLDEAALTGEPLPVHRKAGERVSSGVVNAGSPFDLRATTCAADSAYAGIVRLVREAQASTAPFVRLANRYAALFLPVTVAIAALAWGLSGDAVRAVAVLVVATPCPLLLAAPVAIVSGLSRAAHRGIVIKGGGALERLAAGRTLLLDKTGTLTRGRPSLATVVAPAHLGEAEVLRLAASLDQVSPHTLASAVVRAAHDRRLHLRLPDGVVEEYGYGVRGMVAGRLVALGRADWAAAHAPGWVRRVRRRAALDDALTVFVAVDGRLVGALLFHDPIRPDAAQTLRRLRAAGLTRMVLVTGDRADVADSVATAMGIDTVLAERTPAEKVEAVGRESRHADTIMVGDGLNDAPALAAAGIGVALGAYGSSASSEAADVVLTVDRLDRLAEAISIAHRARRIARQSVLAGMGLSFAFMGIAALGWLAPTAGAIVQELIDVAVIVNALRVLTPGRDRLPHLSGADAALTGRFIDEHTRLRADVDGVRDAADRLTDLPADQATTLLRHVHHFLVAELLPHEQAEEHQLYPVVARALGGQDPTGTMSRAHAEITHLVRRIGRLLDDLGDDVPDPDDLSEFRRLLYGLHAILRLHFTQEEEGYFTLAELPPQPVSATTGSTNRS